MSTLKSDTLRGLKWSSIGSVSTTILNFLFGIGWARLLTPADFGTVGMVTLFFSLSGVFIDGGFGQALVRKAKITDEDASTVFYFNIITAGFFALMLWIAAPWIASFLGVAVLCDVVRVQSVGMFIGSMASVHYAVMSHNIDFKHPAILGWISSVSGGIIGLFMAYMGMGLWALVYSGLITTIIRVFTVWFISRWRPKWVFSWKSFKELFGFGGNLVVNGILEYACIHGTGTIMGKYFSPTSLGYFSKGQSTAQLPSMYLNGIIQSVTYPAFSKLKDDNDKLNNVYRRTIRVTSLVICFAMIMLFVLTKPLVLFLYSSKWAPSIIFIQVACFQYLVYHVHALNWNFLLVRGRSDLAMYKEFICKAVRISSIVVGLSISPLAVAYFLCIGTLFDLFINAFVTYRISGLTIFDQIKDFLYYTILSALASLPVWGIVLLDLPDILSLFLGGIVGCGTYLCVLKLTHDNTLIELSGLSPFFSKILSPFI